MDLEARACVCRTHTFKEGDEGGFWGCSFYGSTPIQVKHGDPQSSTTSVPLFFMVPINDIDVFQNIPMCADDTKILVKSKLQRSL